MATLNLSSLKSVWLVPLALLGSALCAQTPEAPKSVPLKEEPHHRVLFENGHVRVFRFSLPGHQATLLHSHDLPYVPVSLGPADYVNAVAGKPEAHVTLTDGQVGYSRGGFAHIVRADAGSPVNNFTIELLHPQGDPRNLCQKVTDGPLNDCPSANRDAAPANPEVNTLAQAVEKRPLFETGEIVVTSFSIARKEDYSESGPQFARLLVVEQDSELKVDVPEERSRSLHGGEVLWLEAGQEWRIVTPGDHKVTRFLVITFKGGDATKKP
jgi:hypothetical protein